MTRQRLTVLILGALGVLAIAVWAVTTPGRHDASPAGAAVAPAPRPTDSTWPLLDTGPSAASSAVPPVTPSATAPASGAPAAGEGGAVAEPFVQPFAKNPGVRPLRPLPSPTATLKVKVNVDGCDRSYGAPTQCVPWTFPAGTTDKCAWLTAHGFKELKVVGADRQKLDADADGIACNE